MKITKYGKVMISRSEILITGFEVDGQMPNSWLPANAGDLIVAWAIERLTKVQGEVNDSQGKVITSSRKKV